MKIVIRTNAAVWEVIDVDRFGDKPEEAVRAVKGYIDRDQPLHCRLAKGQDERWVLFGNVEYVTAEE